MKVDLTKNERKVLQLLIVNSKVSDAKIGNELNISKTAIGKIRKKLEKNIIKGYSVDLDFSKLGIDIFAIELVKIKPSKKDFPPFLELIKFLEKSPHCIKICKFAEQNLFCIEYAFKNLTELENFFNNHPYGKIKKNSSNGLVIEQVDLKIFSHQNLLKNNWKDLLSKSISEK